MDKIELTCPKSWSELTQEQLRYTFFLLSTFADKVMVKTYMFVRFTGINVIKKNRFGWQCVYQPEGEKRKRVFYLQLWQIRSFLEQLAWVDSIEQMDNRLDVVQGLEAVHPLLQEDTEHHRIITFEESSAWRSTTNAFTLRAMMTLSMCSPLSSTAIPTSRVQQS